MIWARAIMAWPVIAVQLLVFGTTAFALTPKSGTVSEREKLIGTFIPLWRGLALLNLAIAPLTFIEVASAMADMGWREVLPLLPQILRETYAGRVWEWRFAAVSILAIASWIPVRRMITSLMLMATSAASLLLETMTSHAIDKGIAAAAVDFVHEAAVGLWIGAIVGLWIGFARARLGPSWLRETAPWVSRMAGWTVAVLILSGLYTAYNALGADPHRLIYAAYGRTLVVKLAAASIVLLIGAYNRFLILPRLADPSARDALLRNVSIESVLLMGVVGLAAILANTPPVHH